MNRYKSLAGLAAVAALWATPALAASSIECVDGGYTTEEYAHFQRFVDGFNMQSWSQQGPPQDMLGVISGRAGVCADQHGWSPEAIEQSVFYRLGGLLESALIAHKPITDGQMTRLRAAVASADKARLRRLFGGMLDTSLAGEEVTDPSQSDTMFMGSIFMRSGIPTNKANAEFAGAWMAATVMRDMSAERFAAR